MVNHHHHIGGVVMDHTGTDCPNDPCDRDECKIRPVGRSGE